MTKAEQQEKNKKIRLLLAEGYGCQYIAQEVGVNPGTVTRVRKMLRKKFGEEEAVATEVVPPSGMGESGAAPMVVGNAVPRVVEDPDKEQLNMELQGANVKIARAFIRMANDLKPEELKNISLSRRMKYLQMLHPMVIKQVRDLKPRQINFFVGEGKAEDIERKLLEYATGSAIKNEKQDEE